MNNYLDVVVHFLKIQAWICIILSIICITVALYYVNQSSTERRFNLSDSIEYVTVVLFSQGNTTVRLR